MLEMREHRERGRFFKFNIERSVEALDNARDGAHAIVETGEDGLLAPLAMHDVGLHHPLRGLDAAAMARQEHLVMPFHQALERGEELRHVALGRRDDRRVPTHHVIAGEDSALADERKNKMVRRVARQVQHVEREALDPDRVAVSELPVRREARIDESVAEAGNARAARRSRRPERGDLSAGESLQAARAVAMVAMTVRDENRGETLALDSGRDRLQMALVSGTRIDDGDFAAPDDVAVGAEKRVGPGIVGYDAANAGANLLGHAIIDVLVAVEGKLRRHDLRKLFSLIAPIVAERI